VYYCSLFNDTLSTREVGLDGVTVATRWALMKAIDRGSIYNYATLFV
jgi:hypothetical protein